MIYVVVQSFIWFLNIYIQTVVLFIICVLKINKNEGEWRRQRTNEAGIFLYSF